jgi:hypothetical protein
MRRNITRHGKEHTTPAIEAARKNFAVGCWCLLKRFQLNPGHGDSADLGLGIADCGLRIGDWGLRIGDCGLGIENNLSDNQKLGIRNPQSEIISLLSPVSSLQPPASSLQPKA